jgi:hypothetical protein
VLEYIIIYVCVVCVERESDLVCKKDIYREVEREKKK